MGARTGLGVVFAVIAALCFAGFTAAGLPAQDPVQDITVPVLPLLEKTVAVPAAAGWVDTGIDVEPGQELRFTASGRIDLQKGNPEASCGPEGIDLITVEQPVPNGNLGALVGKVAQLVARRIDEDSGMEIRDEIFILFLIGPESALTVPFKGRLYLGVNENVLRDNGGEYSVVVVRRPV